MLEIRMRGVRMRVIRQPEMNVGNTEQARSA
jgi:hypothetical protein